MSAAVIERVTAVCARLADEGIVVSCELDGGTVCVHVDSPRPDGGPVTAVTEAHVLHAIGPYETVEARNADLDRLRGLPLGAPEYHGGQEFFAATMAEASDGWHDETVEPSQVADATTIRGFHAAFSGDPEEEDE